MLPPDARGSLASPPISSSRVRMRAGILLVWAGTVAACAPAGHVAIPVGAAGGSAFALERGVERVARTHAGAEALWPGFDPLAVPLAVYDGEGTYLFRHPAPPEGFAPVPGTRPAAHVYEGRHEALSANSSAEIGGVPTATVLLDRPDPDGQAGALAPLAVHEAFHVYQRARHPRWSGNEADLFVYPTDAAGPLALRRLETEALRRALASEGADSAACWSRRALALRRERHAALDSASAAYERGTELNEGLAAYVEARAAGRGAVGLPPGEFGAAEVRRRAYATGPALAFLLDRFAPGWPRSFEADDGQVLEDALARALGPGPACAFGDAETAESERRAQADVGALAAERAGRVAASEGRPGWSVVVEAAGGELLWPEGFDPLNVERVGPARVLHARFLRLGNGAGHLEALDTGAADVEALTEGAGPHPLFNGVQRVVLAGLAEPEVSEVGGTVAVRAPGFRAEFREASFTRSGHVVTIRLRP